MSQISIITASYNYAKYIGETMESVIKQTFQDWEMLVIDDGSKDNSIDVIKEYVQKDNRIKLITHPNNENKGLVETLKLGILQAQGEYIVFLESDDYIREDYLEKKFEYFTKYSDVGFIYNDIETFGEKQKLRRKLYFRTLRSYWKKHNYPHSHYEEFYFRNLIPTFSCVMLKKDLFDELNWNSPDPACIDWWIWTQIVTKTKCYFLQDKLTYWRLHKDSYLNITRDIDKLKIIKFIEGIYGFLPPIKHLTCKIKFLIKQLRILLIYKTIINSNGGKF